MWFLSTASSTQATTATAFAALTTRDGRLVYLTARAKPAQPGLEQALTSLLYELGRRSYSELYGDTVRVDLLERLKSMGFRVDELEVAVSLRCPQCAASIQLSPETVVYVCPYCGWSGDVYGRSIKVLTWPPAQRYAIEQLANRLGGVLLSAELKYIPVWVVEGEGEARYTATVTYVVTRRVGKQEYTERRRMRTSGSVSVRSTEYVIARLNAEVFGAEEISEWLSRSWYRSKPRELSAEEAKPLASYILAPEIAQEEAAEISIDRIEDKLAEKAKAEARARAPGRVEDVVLDTFHVNARVNSSTLVYVPYWYFTYRRREGLFAGAAVGTEASSRVAEAPLSNASRAALLAAAGLVSLASGVVVQALAEAESGGLVVLGFILGLGGAYFLTQAAYRPARRVRV